MTLPFPRLPRRAALATSLCLALGGVAAGVSVGLASQPAQAQGTPGLLEFRWDNNRDYRKLYYFMTDTGRSRRSEYYLLLRPRDRKTAILKLDVTVPDNFDAKITPQNIKLCEMKEGGMLARTRCQRQIPATIEVNGNGTLIEIFPETPIPDNITIGVYMNIFNPFDIGMYQFNARAQAPGDVPFAGYLGSWLIQIDPPGN